MGYCSFGRIFGGIYYRLDLMFFSRTNSPANNSPTRAAIAPNPGELAVVVFEVVVVVSECCVDVLVSGVVVDCVDDADIEFVVVVVVVVVVTEKEAVVEVFESLDWMLIV